METKKDVNKRLRFSRRDGKFPEECLLFETQRWDADEKVSG